MAPSQHPHRTCQDLPWLLLLWQVKEQHPLAEPLQGGVLWMHPLNITCNLHSSKGATNHSPATTPLALQSAAGLLPALGPFYLPLHRMTCGHHVPEFLPPSGQQFYTANWETPPGAGLRLAWGGQLVIVRCTAVY